MRDGNCVGSSGQVLESAFNGARACTLSNLRAIAGIHWESRLGREQRAVDIAFVRVDVRDDYGDFRGPGFSRHRDVFGDRDCRA